MTTLREAAQRLLQAIDAALPYAPHRSEFDVAADAADDLRAALNLDQELNTNKEPAQEPAAWMDIADDGTRLDVRMWSDGNREEVPLYTAPPQRKPLTDEQLDALRQNASGLNFVTLREFRLIARAIEQAHGIGGQDESA